MAEKFQWADDSIGEFPDPNENRLRISKPSFQNVKDNLTEAAVTLNKVRDVIPKPPEKLVKGLDWTYKNSPIGMLDEGAQLIADDVSKLLIKKGAPNWVGSLAGLGITIAAPSGFEGKASAAMDVVRKLNQARKLSIKSKSIVKNPFNKFPPNQTLQPAYATAGGGNLKINQANVTQDLSQRVLKIDKTTDSNILEQLYPGNKKPQRLIKETLSADSGPAKEYRELLEKYAKINKDIPLTTVGKKRVKITPVQKELFEKDVKRLVELKKELKLPNQNKFNQELGAFMDESGELYRLGSKGDFKPEGYAGIQKRLENQGLIPVTEKFDPLRPKWGPFTNSSRQKITTKLGLNKPEKDHIVRLENQIAILGKKLDVKGGFVDRDPKFMDELAGELHRRGHSLGDQNLNFLQMSEEAHRTGKYSRHIVSQSLTDAELPHTYLEADEIFTTLKDGTKKWLKVDVIDINKGTFRLKDGDKIIPNKNIKSKGNYKFAGAEYEKGQRQGVSLTTRRILSKIDNPKELADAYELFTTDAGAHEIMSGIQTAASHIYDNPKQLDELSKQIRNENIPNMIKFLKYALTTPQFKSDPVYTKLLNRFTDKLKQNMAEFGEALKIDATRPSLFIETKNKRLR